MEGVSLRTMARIRDTAMRRVKPITLQDLLHHRGSLDRTSHPSAFVHFASFLQEEIPLRFSHQLMQYYRLPYLLWRSEPFVTVHDAHLRAFDELSSFRRIETGRDVLEYTDFLRHHLQDTDSIGSFRSGLDELKRNGFSGEDLSALPAFLDKFIVLRIGNQVLANHFLDFIDQGEETASRDTVISECLLSPMLKAAADQVCTLAERIYGVYPEITFDDALDAKVMVVPSHLQFIFRELLKNAVHATMERHRRDSIGGSSLWPPPVQVSLRPGKIDFEVRVADQGGGMRQNHLKRIWEYGFSGSPFPSMTSEATSKNEGMDETGRPLTLQMSGYGMGVPLARHYARFFGGEIYFSSVFGYGTDVSVRVNRLLSIEAKRKAEQLGAGTSWVRPADSTEEFRLGDDDGMISGSDEAGTTWEI